MILNIPTMVLGGVAAALVIGELVRGNRAWRIRRRRYDRFVDLKRHFDAKEWDQAHQKINQWMSQDPDDANLHYAQAFIAYQRGRLDHAQDEVKLALAREPRHAPARYLHAHLLYYALGKKEEAVALLTDLLKEGNEVEKSANTLGLIYLLGGDMVKSEAVLKQGLKHQATAELRNTLALLLIKQGHLEEASKELKEGVVLQPNDMDMLLNLGNLHAMRMDYKEAEAVFERCAALNATDSMIPYWRGCALASRRQWPEAEAQLHRSIDLQPSFAMAYYQLARVLEKAGRQDDAQRSFQTAVQLDPTLMEDKT